MNAFARSISPETDPPEPPSEDPAGRGRPAGSERRGPMRPERLAPSRARIDGAGLIRVFSVVDAALVAALALVVCALAAREGLLEVSLVAVLPYLAGATVMTWGLKAFGAYRLPARETLAAHLLRAFLVVPAAGLAVAAAQTLVRLPPLQSAALAFWLCLSGAAVLLSNAVWWTIVRRWRAAGRLTPNIVVVGATPNAERLIEDLIRSREANVLGVFDDRLARAPASVRGVPVLGTTKALVGHRVTPYVDRIVVTVPASAERRVREIIGRLAVLPNEVALFLDFPGRTVAGGQGAVARIGAWPIAHVSGKPRDEARALWKRVQDLVIGALMLVAAAPVMALIALAIRADSPGPIFFRQRRHGFNNEEIVVWKFRSMRQESADATASRQVSADDDRVTRVGRFIRKASLDELPQIFNVLGGEMSLVGPRPHAIGMKTGDVESARLVAEYAHRHRLKPGMTGWAAIKGSRGPVDTPEAVRRRVELDVEYIERQSFWLDLYIIAVTAPCLLGDRAAVR
jgi:Undecaprenyl-phosphate glucose phosphotransferase